MPTNCNTAARWRAGLITGARQKALGRISRKGTPEAILVFQGTGKHSRSQHLRGSFFPIRPAPETRCLKYLTAVAKFCYSDITPEQHPRHPFKGEPVGELTPDIRRHRDTLSIQSSIAARNCFLEDRSRYTEVQTVKKASTGCEYLEYGWCYFLQKVGGGSAQLFSELQLGCPADPCPAKSR